MLIFEGAGHAEIQANHVDRPRERTGGQTPGRIWGASETSFRTLATPSLRVGGRMTTLADLARVCSVRRTLSRLSASAFA